MENNEVEITEVDLFGFAMVSICSIGLALVCSSQHYVTMPIGLVLVGMGVVLGSVLWK